MLKGLNHITIAVSDIEQSLSFYVDLLGFKAHAKWNTGAYLSIGKTWFCLIKDAPDEKNDYTHFAFSIDAADFDQFKERLQAANVQEWQENRSEGDSVYFLDPDGHKLEAHVGDLESRLDSLRCEDYERLEYLLKMRG